MAADGAKLGELYRDGGRYVNPTRSLVVVEFSAFGDYGTSLKESAYREIETIEFLRAIVRAREAAKPAKM